MQSFISVMKMPSALAYVFTTILLYCILPVVFSTPALGFMLLIPGIIGMMVVYIFLNNDLATGSGLPRLTFGQSCMLETKIVFDSMIGSALLSIVLFPIIAFSIALFVYQQVGAPPPDPAAAQLWAEELSQKYAWHITALTALIAYIGGFYCTAFNVRGWMVRKPILFNSVKTIKMLFTHAFNVKRFWPVMLTALTYACINRLMDNDPQILSTSDSALLLVSGVLVAIGQIWLMQNLFGVKNENVTV